MNIGKKNTRVQDVHENGPAGAILTIFIYLSWNIRHNEMKEQNTLRKIYIPLKLKGEHCPACGVLQRDGVRIGASASKFMWDKCGGYKTRERTVLGTFAKIKFEQ